MTANGGLKSIRMPMRPEEELRFGLTDQPRCPCVEILCYLLEGVGEGQGALVVAIPLSAWPELAHAVLHLDDVLTLKGLLKPVDQDDSGLMIVEEAGSAVPR
jgi:hypothetical protein